MFLYIFVKNISRFSDTCFRKIFRGPRTMLRLRRATYKLELCGHRDSNLSSVFEGMRSLEHDTLLIYCNYVALQNSSVFEGMCSLGLVELLDTPYVKYFAVLGLCCACGGPLINWNSMDTGTQTLVRFSRGCVH